MSSSHESGSQGSYSLGREESLTSEMQRRQIGDRSLFTQHLRPGMQLLDVGSGPGAATLELAGLLAPGATVGVDNDEAMVERARTLVREKGLESSVSFEVGDAYSLPFPDGSFDAAWSQFVFVHLRDPGAAMKEVLRVLRPGGVFGLMDPDFGYCHFEPYTDSLRQLDELFLRAQTFNGGDMYRARKYRRFLLEAGFSRAEQSVNVRGYGTSESIREAAARWHMYLRAQLKTAVEQSWIDEVTNQRLLQDLLDWGERLDAFATDGYITAVGFID